MLPLRFQIGARTLAVIPRRLHRLALGLDQVLAERAPDLPALYPGAHGYQVMSLPQALVPRLAGAGLLAFERQRYTRHYTDLTIGYHAWLAALSGNARSSLKRKSKKLAQHPDGMTIRAFRTAGELAEFHALARPLAALTYQERLLGFGLPDDADFLREMYALAAEDRVRAWLLTLGGRAVAYLWCSAEGHALRYDYVGHDPALSDWSPGTVLHAAAFRDLCAEGRFARFDFTEGEGQHKRQFATGGVACVDLLLLRDTLANRATIAALRTFDLGLGWAKRAVAHPGLARLARRIGRAA
jgi:CelD/BcsL family acetyltransferase involved in cellulose biosynthesis